MSSPRAPNEPTSRLRDARTERQRTLLRDLVMARTALRVARQRGDREAERRARSKLLAVHTALQRSGR